MLQLCKKMYIACAPALLLVLCGGQVALGAAIQYINYTVQNAVPFNGDNSTATDPLCELISTWTLGCDAGSKLNDGDIGAGSAAIGPEKSSYFAFSRQSGQSAFLEFFLPTFYNDMLDIVLHFLNRPNQFIGLPTLSIHTSDSVAMDLPFEFDDNHDLHPSDATLRSVTLQISLDFPIDSLEIVASFKEHDNVNWLLISEVEFYSESRIRLQDSSLSYMEFGPDNLQSSVRFSCTVVNSGSFEWSWEYGGLPLVRSDRNRVWIADATRSSQLEIYKLRYADHGNYSCVVKHQRGSTCYTKTFQLVLKAKLEPESSQVIFAAGTVAMLACEAYGYLSGDIEWSRNGQLIQAEGNYSLTISSGNLDSISIDGDSQKSSIVAMQVKKLDESDGGVYTCSLRELRMNITLIIGVPSVTASVTAVTTTPTETVNCISPDVLLVQILVNVLLGVLFIATNIAFIELCRRKRSLNAKLSFKEKGSQTSENAIPIRIAGPPLGGLGFTRSLEPIHTNEDNQHDSSEKMQLHKAKSLDYLQFTNENELEPLKITSSDEWF